MSGKEDSSSNAPEPNYAQRVIKETLADLQKHWKCSIHSKNKECFCWQFEGICYELSFNQLGFWAVEIVRFNKPRICLYTDSSLD